MRVQLPFVTRRRHERALAAEQAETLRVKKVKDDWWQRHDRIAEELAAVSIVNACLTEDLTELRAKLAASMDAESALARQIHEMAQPVEPTDDEMDDLNRLVRERAARRAAPTICRRVSTRPSVSMLRPSSSARRGRSGASRR